MEEVTSRLAFTSPISKLKELKMGKEIFVVSDLAQGRLGRPRFK